MNNTIGISGSPKINRGAAYFYLKKIDINNIISSYVYSLNDTEKIMSAHTIVFTFPLYVDSLPSHFVKFLNLLENSKIENKNIYAICNLGFHEGVQGDIALDIIRNFCLRTNNNYMGGISIGTGPIGFMKYPLINIGIKRELKRLKKCINNNTSYQNTFIQSKLPRFIYRKCANIAFNHEIKKNLTRK